ncbi:ABC transporter permease [Vibrio sp. SS-MA-C1-2]|uniref:ABC transporter permease n=1 Tax=Vibrio sp. SS-MA-C1-2 TaxID=2908646 RepID=UPI001F3139AD|nr:FtsX-like permease family protein [Vibrio sp. SS-MA-C1-2]UJF18791.1 ABC transporter permease [Vibrio sp. SS-MA-C1-2]
MNNQNVFLWRWSWRELYQAQLWPIVVALALVIATVFAISALAGRLSVVLEQQSRTLMAADQVLKTSNPISPELMMKGEQLDLTESFKTKFSTMAFSDAQMQLVSVTAVDDKYPLRGVLELKSPQGIVNKVSQGEVWLSAQLFSLLDVKANDTLYIGDAALTVKGQIIQQPELSFNPFSQLPSVFIHQQDVATSNVIQPGSRISYYWLLAGSDDNLSEIKQAYTPVAGESWRDSQTQSRGNELMQRAQKYLSLSITLVILMAGATLAMTCHHYVESRVETVAVLKSMGASRKWVIRWLLRQLLLLMSCAVVLGLLLGLGLEVLIRQPLSTMLPDTLPPINLLSWIIAPIVAMIVALPALGLPLYRLLATPALTVMQRDIKVKTSIITKVIFFALPTLSLIWWFGSDIIMWLIAIILLLVLAFLAAVGAGLIRLIQRFLPTTPAVKLAISRISRSTLATGTQLSALSISLMLLATLWLLRGDLIADWQKSLPEDAPNVFAINISPAERADYLTELDKAEVPRSQSFPMIRGRMIGVNGEDISTRVQDREDEGGQVLRRELNFTWLEAIPTYNELIEGEWGDKSGVSIESSIAKNLGIKVGDQIDFIISGESISAPVNSIRKVEWRDMKPNFYVIFTPDLLKQFSMGEMLSFRIDEQNPQLLTTLARDFPTVTQLDIRQLMVRIQLMIEQISAALSVLGAVGVVSGLLLMLAILRLSLVQRQQEVKLYRLLGSSRKKISATLNWEFGVIAVMAGLIAVFGAEATLAVVLKWGFEMTPVMHPILWLLLPSLAVGLVLFSVRGAIKRLINLN